MTEAEPAATVKAERLREARTYLEFSLDDVSGAMNRERRWVDDIENGRQRITGEELRKLSRLYQRPVAWLCGESKFEPGPGIMRMLEDVKDAGDREAILDFAEFLQGAGPPPPPDRERRQR